MTRVAAALVVAATAAVAGASTRCGGIVGGETSAPDASTPTSRSAPEAGPMPDAASTPGDAAPVCAPPMTLCADACVDERTDDANCGGCGLACSTGCTAGRCVVTLYSIPSSNMEYVVAIAVDATNLYWAQSVDGVMSVPIAGGPVTTLATGPAYSLAIDATRVYYENWDSTDGGVSSVPLHGGPATVIASGIPSGAGLAVDGANVYWTQTHPTGPQSCEVMVCSAPLGGGSPSTLAAAMEGCPGVEGFQSLGLSEGRLLWGDWTAPDLLSTPIDGGVTATLATSVPGIPMTVVADARNVYSAQYDWANGFPCPLLQEPLAGGTPITLDHEAFLGALAVDDASVYYFRNRSVADDGGVPFAPALLKVPIGGGAPVALVTNLPPYLYLPYYAIAVDATSVYVGSSAGIFKVTPK